MHNNTFNIGNFKANHAAVNLGGTVQGDQIGSQANYTFPEPKQAEATHSLAELLQDIRSRHPQATDVEILGIVENGLATMQQTNPQNDHL